MHKNKWPRMKVFDSQLVSLQKKKNWTDTIIMGDVNRSEMMQRIFGGTEHLKYACKPCTYAE